jgi:anthranilate phosphoribosyltransferase
VSRGGAEKFSEFIRTIGTGPGRSRPLTEAESHDASRMMLSGAATDAQLGALLMLWRYKRETPAELAGFVRAARETVALPTPAPAVDLDWPSYALGTTRGAPWYLASALLAAEAGVRVLMHGLAECEPFAGPTASALAALGVAPARSAEEACAQLASRNFAFLPLGVVCPALQRLMNLRVQLGLRSTANTAARLLNPFRAPAVLGGVFHPQYRALHQEAAALLGERRVGVLKGRGESERDPTKPCELFVVEARRAWTEEWPPIPDDDDAAVIGTAGIALRLAGRAVSPAEADALARELWARRSRDAIKTSISQQGSVS